MLRMLAAISVTSCAHGRAARDMRHHGHFRVQSIAGSPAAAARAAARRARRRRAARNRARRSDRLSTTCPPRPILMTIAPLGIIAKVRAHRMPSVSRVSGNRQTAMSVWLDEPLELVRRRERSGSPRPAAAMRTQADTGKPSDFSTSAGAFAISPRPRNPMRRCFGPHDRPCAAIRGWPAPPGRAASRGETAARA